MSETKFTKGEWVVDFNGDVSVCMGNSTIASMSDMECAYIKEDNVHNTFLIAAAPEMYEMLENSLNEIYMLVDKVNEKGAGFTDYDDMHMVREIKFLLAKARGEK